MAVNVSLPAAVTVASAGVQGVKGDTGATGNTGAQGAPGDAAALTRTVVSNNADYTVLTTDRFIAVTVLNAGIAVILPDPTTMANKIVTVKDEAGMAALNTITVKPANGTQHIDGDGTKQINMNYGIGRYYSNGVQWYTA